MSNYILYISASYCSFVIVIGAYLFFASRRHRKAVRQIQRELSNVQNA